MKKIKTIGYIAVDSGQVLICDPCYINTEWNKEEKQLTTKNNFTEILKKAKGNFSYEGVCQASLSENKGGQLNFKLGHIGAGVASSTYDGDGLYPVIAHYKTDKYCKTPSIYKLEIIFN